MPANSVGYTVRILARWRWRPDYPRRTLPRETIPRGIAAGLRYAAMSPKLMNVTGRGMAFGLSAASVLALLPVVASELLQGTAVTFGLLLGCYGLGAVLGALSNARLRERFDNETVVRLAFAGFALSALALGLSRTLRVLSCIHI